jgi:Ca2+-binding RTX toxin-like protein
VVYGGDGDDRIAGETSAGRDVIYGGAGNDIVIQANGDDFVYGGWGNDFINVGTEIGDAAQVWGGPGADRIIGGRNDILYGGDGADTLDSGGFLYGGGNDRDRDVFAYSEMASSDHYIYDFEGGIDKIDLSKVDARPRQPGNNQFVLVREFTGQAGQLQIGKDGPGRFIVMADLNGDKQLDWLVGVMSTSKVYNLTANDFML